MTKSYCDICGEKALEGSISSGSEAWHSQHFHSKIGNKKFKFQINGYLWRTDDDVCWNFFDVCKKCLSKMILAIEETEKCDYR